MDSAFFIRPLLAGLAVGAFCLTYCFPFMAPFLVAEERPQLKNLLLVLEFLIGRILGYLCFGFLAGLLGSRFDSSWLRLATNLSFILLSVVLFFYVMGLVRDRGAFCASARFFRSKSPVLMGFLMGINICPPFLLAVLDVVTHKNALYGMAYFALFFLASSVYFLPAFLLGMVARTEALRKVARVSGFLTAGLFFIYGVYSLMRM